MMVFCKRKCCSLLHLHTSSFVGRIFFKRNFQSLSSAQNFFEERELKKILLTKAASWVAWLGKKFGHMTSTTYAQGSRKAQMAHFDLFWPNQKIVFMSFWVGGASERVGNIWKTCESRLHHYISLHMTPFRQKSRKRRGSYGGLGIAH